MCHLGYATSVYATWATRCPDFALRAPLPDTPQEDERTGRDRRAVHLPVQIERRSGRDRRAASALP
jgi:hypothetical protein